MKESTSPSESTATSPSESTAQAQATLTELVLEDNELTDEALAGVSGGRAWASDGGRARVVLEDNELTLEELAGGRARVKKPERMVRVGWG